MEDTRSLKAMLEQVTLGNLMMNSPKQVTVDKTATVHETLEVMYNNEVSLLPVVDKSTNPPNFLGFVNDFDILDYLLRLWNSERRLSLVRQPYNPKMLQQKDVEKKLSTLGESFANYHIGSLVDTSRKDVFCKVSETDSLKDVVKSCTEQEEYRVAIVDRQGTINRTIAQADIVRFLHKNKQYFGGLLQESVDDLGLVQPQHELVLLFNTDPAISSFQTMQRERLSDAPIINSDGALVGTLSLKHLRLLNKELFHNIMIATKDFVNIGRETHSPPVYCYPQDTLDKVLSLFEKKDVHLVWVVDEDKQPFCSISVTDICHFISSIADGTFRND